MQRVALLLLTLAALLWMPTVHARANGTDGADDQQDVRRRIELIRQLPREDQERLREALKRFRSLPETKQRELRSRAREVGDERLRELVDRDIPALRKRQQSLERERAEIIRLLGGEARFAELRPVERRYIASITVREFQRHVRRSLLNIGGPQQMEEFNRLSRAEKKRRYEDAVRAVQARLLDQEAPEYREAVLTMSPGKQHKERKKLLVEYRLRLVPSFVGIFEGRVLGPYMRRPPEDRLKIANRWATKARWFEMRRRLDKEVGVTRSTLRLLNELGPEEWARIRDVYIRTEAEGLSPEDRRVRMTTEIQELHGRSAVGADDRRAHGKRRLRRLLRDQHRARAR